MESFPIDAKSRSWWLGTTIVAYFMKFYGVPSQNEGLWKGRVGFYSFGFEKWVIRLRYYGQYNMKDKHPAWILPATFCVRRYIYDARHLLARCSKHSCQKYLCSEACAKFVEMFDVETPRDSAFHKLIAVEGF